MMVGSPFRTAFGALPSLRSESVLRRDQRRDRRLRPAAANYRHSRHRRDLLRLRALAQTRPGRRRSTPISPMQWSGRWPAAIPATAAPAARRRALHLDPVSAFGSRAAQPMPSALPSRQPLCAAFQSPRAKVLRLSPGRAAFLDCRSASDLHHLFRRGELDSWQQLYAELYCLCRDRRDIALRRLRRRDRLDLRRLCAANDRRPALGIRSGPALAAAIPRRRPACGGKPRLLPAASHQEQARYLQGRLTRDARPISNALIPSSWQPSAASSRFCWSARSTRRTFFLPIICCSSSRSPRSSASSPPA